MRAMLFAAFARLRNHIITGFIFILPVLITLIVIMRFWNHLLVLGGRSSKLLHVHTVLGPSGDAVMAIVILLLICVAAGYLVRVSFLKRVSERIDQQLNTLVPGYSQLRSETRKKVGVDAQQQAPVFDACLVKVEELWEPGYIIDRNFDGTFTVFVPQAPTTAYGHVYVAHPSQLKMLGIDSVALNERLKQLGKGVIMASAAQEPERVDLGRPSLPSRPEDHPHTFG
jgi:uncharacterized membrane protein